ncbi:MAG: barstar family protein [Oscillospiraceae bacterium]|nr:barstar family protein [Oscillospiraceae bacterium]
MKEIIIDGERFSDIDGFYREIISLLSDGSSISSIHNLDALHDLLGGGFGVHACGEPLHIIWMHAEKSREDLGYQAAADYWYARMQRCHPSNQNHFQKLAEDALHQKGKTLFEMITEMISDSEAAHSLSFL